MKNRRFSLIPMLLYLAVLVAVFTWASRLWDQNTPQLPYSQVVELIRNEQVSSFVVEDDTITLNLKTPIDGQSTITTTLADPEQFRLEMKDTLTAQVESGVMEYYHFVPEKSFSPYSLVLPLLLVGLVLLFVWAMFMSRANNNNPLNNFGKARTVLGVPDGKKVTFDDVAGAD